MQRQIKYDSCLRQHWMSSTSTVMQQEMKDLICLHCKSMHVVYIIFGLVTSWFHFTRRVILKIVQILKCVSSVWFQLRAFSMWRFISAVPGPWVFQELVSVRWGCGNRYVWTPLQTGRRGRRTTWPTPTHTRRPLSDGLCCAEQPLWEGRAVKDNNAKEMYSPIVIYEVVRGIHFALKLWSLSISVHGCMMFSISDPQASCSVCCLSFFLSLYIFLFAVSWCGSWKHTLWHTVNHKYSYLT